MTGPRAEGGPASFLVGVVHPEPPPFSVERLLEAAGGLRLLELARAWTDPPDPLLALGDPALGLSVDVRAPAILSGGRAGTAAHTDLGELRDEARYELWEGFRLALEPARAAGRLGCVVFRFPDRFEPGLEAEAYLAQLPDRLPGDLVVVELATRRWLTPARRPRTTDLLRDLGLVLAASGSISPDASPRLPCAEATSDRLAFVRLRPAARSARRQGHRRGPDGRSALPALARLSGATDVVHVVVEADPAAARPVARRLAESFAESG